MTTAVTAIPAAQARVAFSIRISLVVLFLITFASQSAVAQSNQLPVRLKLEPLSIRGRSGGPIPVQIKLEYNRNQMLEGDLVLQIYNSVVSSEDLTATMRYEGIVLQGTDYIFNVVLPPIEHSFTKLYQITAWFETDTERISLTSDPDQIDPPEPHDLLSIAGYERATLICSCSGQRDYLKQSKNRAFLSNRLSLARYNPATNISQNQTGQTRKATIDAVQDYAVNWDALLLPEDPLHYCSFDVVLLADGALSRLEESQMQALLTWVQAGGSLCVLPDDNRLTTQHLQFLQTLVLRDEDPGLHLSITDENRLLVISDKQNPIVNRHFGVGRVTLLPDLDNLSERMTSEQIGLVVGHLWKARSTSPILQGRKWSQNQNIRQLLQQRGYQITGRPGAYNISGGTGGYRRTNMTVNRLQQAAVPLGLEFKVRPTPNPLASACETALMPKGISMVPTWVIAALLVAYVVVIGPVDYLVLGFFRVRKYTWILFPVVTAAFTALTINIAHRYMASTDSGGLISIVDVNESGIAIRKTDVRLHFYASATQVNNDASQTFTVPAQNMEANDYQFGGSRSPRPMTSNMSYAGRFPQSYTTSQSMRQWEPQSVRTLTFAPEGLKIPNVDWEDSKLVTTASGRLHLARALKKAGTPETPVDAIVLNGDDYFSLFPSGRLFSSQNIAAAKNWKQQPDWQRYHQMPSHESIAALGLIAATTHPGRNDFFNIVSQVSPHGAASMEDLPVMDSSDKSQWVLMIAVTEKTTTRVYRKIYHTSLPRLIAVD